MTWCLLRVCTAVSLLHALSISSHNVSQEVLWLWPHLILKPPWLNILIHMSQIHMQAFFSLTTINKHKFSLCRYFRLVFTIPAFKRSLNLLSISSTWSFLKFKNMCMKDLLPSTSVLPTEAQPRDHVRPGVTLSVPWALLGLLRNAAQNKW